MAKEISVNTDSLAKDIETLKENLNAIKKDLGNMYDRVRVLDAGWDGPANEEFNKQFDADRKNMEAVCKTVEKIIQNLEYARKEYDSCEKSVGSIVAAIKV